MTHGIYDTGIHSFINLSIHPFIHTFVPDTLANKQPVNSTAVLPQQGVYPMLSYTHAQCAAAGIPAAVKTVLFYSMQRQVGSDYRVWGQLLTASNAVCALVALSALAYATPVRPMLPSALRSPPAHALQAIIMGAG